MLVLSSRSDRSTIYNNIFVIYTVKPWFSDLWFSNIPDLMINILCPGKSELYGAESQFNKWMWQVVQQCIWYDDWNLGTLAWSFSCHNGIIIIFWTYPGFAVLLVTFTAKSLNWEFVYYWQYPDLKNKYDLAALLPYCRIRFHC